MSGKLDGRSYAGTLKNFQTTHIGYRAHRAVIFAIAWHLVFHLWRTSCPVLFQQYLLCLQCRTGAGHTLFLGPCSSEL